MEYHPECKAFLELRSKSGPGKKYYDCDSVEEAREMHSATFSKFRGSANETPQFEGTKREIFVPSPDVKDGIPCDIYIPNNCDKDPPILIMFHGGGLVLGTRKSTEGVCLHLASGGKCVIVNVEYRLGPVHKYPAMMDDGCTVTRWVLANKELVGGSINSKVGIAGDSGGGNIAASVCHDVDGISFQVLIYPHVSSRGDYSLPSYQQFIDGPVIERPMLEWFFTNAADKKDWSDPRLAPLNRAHFNHLPPALFIVAEYDPIRDDSYEYAKKLTEAGVFNEVYLAKGAVHAFYTLPFFMKELTRNAYAKTIDFIAKFGKSS